MRRHRHLAICVASVGDLDRIFNQHFAQTYTHSWQQISKHAGLTEVLVHPSAHMPTALTASAVSNRLSIFRGKLKPMKRECFCLEIYSSHHLQPLALDVLCAVTHKYF